MLRELGYDTMMLFGLNTSLQVAQDRNRQRERPTPDRMVANMWNMVQDNTPDSNRFFPKKCSRLTD